MNQYTLEVKRQRKLIGALRANYKANGKPDKRERLQREYDLLTKELEVMANALTNPYDYAPEPEYIAND